jgi:sulfoxide reductase heme-binding subunit YedZ
MNERLKNHYMPLISLVFIAGLIFYFKTANRDTINLITQATGYISLVILAISLVLGSINLLLKHKNSISTYLRRDISIIGGGLAVTHSITGLFVHLRGKTWLYFLNQNEYGYSVRLDNFGLANYSGLISALIIMLLLITSNDYLIKKLNPGNWKKIQRLSYFMFILTLIHCYFYRIGKENLYILYWFYIPLFAIVLTFQLIGINLRLTRDKNL